MSSICCPLHGVASCSIISVYKPFDSETGEVLDNLYDFYATWKCRKCNRSGMENLYSIYCIVARDDFYSDSSSVVSKEEIFKQVSARMAIEKQLYPDQERTPDNDVPPLSPCDTTRPC